MGLLRNAERVSVDAGVVQNDQIVLASIADGHLNRRDHSTAISYYQRAPALARNRAPRFDQEVDTHINLAYARIRRRNPILASHDPEQPSPVQPVVVPPSPPLPWPFETADPAPPVPAPVHPISKRIMVRWNLYVSTVFLTGSPGVRVTLKSPRNIFPKCGKSMT